MKLILMTVVLMSSFSALASPLMLKCNINKSIITLNVESLVKLGCSTGSFIKNGEIKKRYNVELCNGSEASGNLEVLAANHWVETATFSTLPGSEFHCYLWRDIVVSGCNPHGHNPNCH